MITTSFYSNPLLKTIDVVPVAISNFPPEQFTDNWYRLIAPPAEFLDLIKRGELTEATYADAYKEQVLDKLDAYDVYNEIIELYGENACIVDYETHCHRRIFADWIQDNIGITILELAQPTEIKDI